MTGGERAKCFAKGCPNWPSVTREGEKGLCSAHAWAPPYQWPRITDEQLDAQALRSAMHASSYRTEPTFNLTPEQRAALATSLRGPGVTDAKAWAYVLRARHEAGANLTQAQIDAYRAVTGTAADPWSQHALA